ncbi:MAG: hypothetical protein ACKVOL_07400 [Novosphingobium sp.]
MTNILHLFATIALALPGLPGGGDVFAEYAAETHQGDVWAAAADPAGSPLLIGKPPVSAEGPGGLAGPLDADTWSQVRIEQRVIIRINPREPGRDALAPQVLPMQPIVQPINPALRPNTVQIRVRERKAGNCMPATGIAAVQPITDGRLMFYMRDRRMLAAGLEKACSARDFYLGFYMSKTTDGQLCVGRDPIHSRAGTTCKLKDVREYVPAQ